MRFGLGKQPAAPQPTDFLFKTFLPRALPAYPKEFGHELSIGVWPMFCNDTKSDCALAGAAHEHMLWTTGGMNPTAFNDEGVLADYSAISGYVPGDPSTDTGCEMHTVMDYRLKTGLIDAAGNRHKIAAYLFLDPGNIDHLLRAMWLFGAVGIGVELPDTAERQFESGQPWTVEPGSEIVGGHYIPGMGLRDGMVPAVTWGAIEPVTIPFIYKNCDEAIAMVTREQIDNTGKTPEGFDWMGLREALNAL
jgi:hypothetical protein